MENGLTASDVALLNNDGFGGANAWFWIVVLFLFNGGFGGNNQVATNADVQRANDQIQTNARFDSLFNNQSRNAMDNLALIDRNAMDNATLIGQNKYDNAILIKDAQYTNLQNTSAIGEAINLNSDRIVSGINAGFANTAHNLCEGFHSVNSGIADVGFQLQNLTCGINRNIDSVKFENAQNTCAITNAIHQEGEATRSLIQANTIQNLRDRLEEKDRLYQAANFQISQNAQSNNLLEALGRWVANPPVPAYYTGTQL